MLRAFFLIRALTGAFFFFLMTSWLCAQDSRFLFKRFNIEHGLSQNTPFCIAQDQEGFLWVGTLDGLSRFDGLNFVVYRHDPNDPYSIADNFVQALCRARDGNLWVGTYRSGVNRFDPKTGRFIDYPLASDPNGLTHNNVEEILEDRTGAIWIGTEHGLNRLDPETRAIERFLPDPNRQESLGGGYIRALYQDSRGTLWVGSDGGLDQRDEITGHFTTHRHNPEDPYSLADNEIRTILEDSRGQIWVGTRKSLELKVGEGRFEHVIGGDQDPAPVSHSIRVIREDRDGMLWVGSDEGIVYLDPSTRDMKRIRHQNGNSNSLSQDFVWDIFEDRGGMIWVGTLNGLNRHDPFSRSFTHYARGLSHRNVWSILKDHQGDLWIGTSRGLNRVSSEQNTVTSYLHEPDNPETPSDNAVFSLLEDDRKRLWIGTRHGGLNRLETGSADPPHFTRFSHDPDDLQSLSSQFVTAIRQDKNQTIWVGTDAGLNRLRHDESGFVRFTHDPNDKNSLSHNKVKSLMVDHDNSLWVGTVKGLNHVDPEQGSIRVYRTIDGKGMASESILATILARNKDVWVCTYGGGIGRYQREMDHFTFWQTRDGLANNIVYGGMQDAWGRLWFSTSMGISVMDPKTETFHNFTALDGLQSNEFNQGAYFTDADGRHYFGGVNGVTAVYPETVERSLFDAPIALTSFLIANQPQHLSPSQRGIHEPGQTKEPLTLDHTQNMMTFEFAALDLSQPQKNRYAYRLAGYNENWIDTDARNPRATYTNLPAGTYTFHVRGTNRDGVWSQKNLDIVVKVLPPPWLSWQALTLYALLILFIIHRYLVFQREKLERERRIASQERAMADQARKVSQQLRQIDRLKDEFLANTSHELRTPLNGIIGIAESLHDGATGQLPDETRSNLKMVISSGKRLASLVNDLLDFSNLRRGNLELRRKPLNLHGVIDVVLTLSQPLVQGRPLRLINQVPESLSPVYADEDRLQQILHNLVGNAIKFTNEGEIRIEATVRPDAEELEISVIDTGIGIPAEKHETIFRSFEQADGQISRIYGGTGLGLAVTRRLVSLHGGRISLASSPGKGSTFSFTLPIATEEPLFEQTRPIAPIIPNPGPEPEPEAETTSAITAHKHQETNEFKILIVDDEPVNRRVLLNHLKPRGYRISEAANGPEALNRVEAETFDMILLDIMMPGMSGYKVCETIRENAGFQELPIIFLTARNHGSDLVCGFEAGGNDFITKPVSKEELLTRVETHLELLDINRNLERLIAQRTQKLSEANQDLDARNRELLTLDRIVRTINQEIELGQVAKILLQQGLKLFPKAEKGALMVWDTSSEVFRMVACEGYDSDRISKLRLPRDLAMELFVGGGNELEQGVFAINNLGTRPEAGRFSDLPLPRSILTMTVPLEQEIGGILLLGSMEDDVFRTSDLERMHRLREHAVSALVKARSYQELQEAQKALIETAHLAGMADIAVNVMHRMGNTLNSVSTSVQLVEHAAEDRKPLVLLEHLRSLLEDPENGLAGLLEKDQRGRQVPRALALILSMLEERFRVFQRESESLHTHIQELTDTLRDQQQFARSTGLFEATDINSLIQKGLRKEELFLREQGIEFKTSLRARKPALLDRSQFLRILTYLIQNAVEAIDKEKGLIHIDTWDRDDGIAMTIRDNGIGIKLDTAQLFHQGFSTKENGRGIGLHYSANAIKGMGGSIRINSEGTGKGATVHLFFPPAIESIQSQSQPA